MAMLNTAAEDELIGRNRCRIKGAAAERSAERLVLIAMGCGLRMGELLGLTRADVDLLHRRVIVTKQRQELSKLGITIRPPKTDAGCGRPSSRRC